MPTDIEREQLEAHISGAGAMSVQQQKIRDFHAHVTSNPEVNDAHNEAVAKSQELGVEHEKEVAAQLEKMKHPPKWTPPSEIVEEIVEDVKEEASGASAAIQKAIDSIT